jgi:hypothetical protein
VRLSGNADGGEFAEWTPPLPSKHDQLLADLSMNQELPARRDFDPDH